MKLPASLNTNPKKEEALNKLKDTENNLLRVNDIVVEVKRQIASIERQAK